MKTNQFINEDVLLKNAIAILMDKLGPVETNRFLSLPEIIRKESVKRHREWQKSLDKSAFFYEVFGK